MNARRTRLTGRQSGLPEGGRDGEPGSQFPASSRLRMRALKITLTYAGFGAVWIFFSDRALGMLVDSPQRILAWSTYKGLAFVVVTSVLLFGLINLAFRAIERSYEALREKDKLLRSGEQHLQAIVRSAMNAVVTFGQDRRILLFNEAAVKLFGCRESDAIGEPVSRFVAIPADDTDQEHHLTHGWRSGGETVALEAAVSRVTVDGQVLRTLILHDVSQRRAHEAEIERMNRLYAALSHVNQAIVWSSERDQLLTKVCEVLVTFGGFRLAWIGWHGENEAAIIPIASWGDDTEYLRHMRIPLDESARGSGPAGTAFKQARPYVCNNLRDDPSTLPWRAESQRRGLQSSAAFPIKDGATVRGVLNVYADETGFFQDKEIALLAEAALDVSFALDNFAREQDHREAEAMASRERAFSDAMLESMPGALYFYDEHGKFLRWNRNFERVTGYSHDEIAQMHPLDFFSTNEKDMLQERIVAVFATGEASVEAQFISRDGRATPYYFTGRSVLVDGARCLAGVGIDISKRRWAENALRELNETLEARIGERTAELQVARNRAEAADRLKSTFLATMSHELRTPLNSIIGFTGIILQGLAGPLNPEQEKQLGMVRGSARHLLELINDVLDISKIEAGQLEVRFERFNLARSIERVTATMRPLTEKKGLRLEAHVAAGIGEIHSDRRRVEQILLNLLNNATKFTERGRVVLTAEFAQNALNGQEDVSSLQIRVTDTGIGIQPEHLSMLFQPFRQIDIGLSRQHEGTGLGLAICRRLATLLGGEIRVCSTPFEGSEFILTLPTHPKPIP